MSAEIFRKSAVQISEMVRRKQISSRELIELHISRVREVSPKLNAVTAEFFESARARALRADEESSRRAPEELPPFHGVPCSIKGGFSIEGEPWVVGSTRRRDIRATSTCGAVQSYLRAGAIPLVQSNVPEALTWIETDNLVYGRTNHPLDPTRTPGGSSGGEAALIATGAVAFGLGTDFAGSIRIPSVLCGIAGHKPTPGWIPSDGLWPAIGPELANYSCIGPLSRAVSDLYPLLRSLVAPEFRSELRNPDDVRAGELDVYFYKDNGEFRVSDEVRAAIDLAVERFARAGARVQEWRPSGFAKSSKLWIAEVEKASPVSFLEVIGDGTKLSLFSEFLRHACLKPRHGLPVLILSLMENVYRLRPNYLESLREDVKRLRSELASRMTARPSVLLCPVFPRTAPKHHVPKLFPFHWSYSGIFNALGLPATAVPLGVGSSGFPVGVQLAALPGQDHLCFAAARALSE